MSQFFADQIDQLDLAIDQLAVRDRNFDRFALMLIDNVIELVLHQHAKDKVTWGRAFEANHKPKVEWKTAVAATGQGFDAKVRYARETDMISASMADSIQYLHAFRNSAYHQGSRHEGILHSVAVFYLRAACTVLGAYRPMFYSLYSGDKISYRAVKYLGKLDLLGQKEAFARACERLKEVALALEEDLVEDLQADMLATIEKADEGLDFIATNTPNKMERSEIVRYCQAWPFAWTDESAEFARSKGFVPSSTGEFIDWLGRNYTWAIRSDPIASWKKRQASLVKERNLDAALKKYCDFMNQTESFRQALDEGVSQVDSYLQEQIDRARGK
jgi:hypothetical protein